MYRTDITFIYFFKQLSHQQWPHYWSHEFCDPPTSCQLLWQASQHNTAGVSSDRKH